MSAFLKFNPFVEKLGQKVFNLNTDTLKIALSNTLPTYTTNSQLSNITQISSGNGYTTGGTAIGSTAYSQTSGTGTLTGSDVTFTASGGSIGPFEYIIAYDDTATNDELIGAWDYGTALTLTDTSTFTIKWSGNTPANSILQLT